MSGEFQNRLRKNLEQAPPAEHPSADVLSAYAEHALSSNEERNVLAHLSVCADCREIVYLAAETEEEPATPATALPEPRRFRWWTWALPVTAVLVVASVFLVQGPLQKSLPRKEVAEAPAQSQLTQSADHLAAKSAPTAPMTEAKPAPAKSATSISTYAPPAATPAERKQAPQNAQPLPRVFVDGVPTESGTRVARHEEKEAPPSVAGGLVQNAPVAPPPPLPALAKDKKAEAQAYAYSAAAPAANAVQVAPEPQATTAEVMRSRDEQHLALKAAKRRSDTSNKADLDGNASSGVARIASAVAPTWSVTPEGRVQHFANGVIQDVSVDPAAHFLAITVVGQSLWVAGKNLALYHSTDNGAHWQRQSVPANPPADIVRLQATDALDATLTTSNSQTFITHDAGATWTPIP
jgi:hypothetical protein